MTNPEDDRTRGWRSSRIAGVVGLALSALLGLTSGPGGAVLFASLYLGATALWTLVRRRSWLGPMRRRAAVALLAVGFVGLVVGAATATPPDQEPAVDVVARTASAPTTPTPAPTTPGPTTPGPTETPQSIDEQAAQLPAPEPAPTADVDAVASAAQPQTALAAVLLLEVKGRAPKTGYSREAFGQAWKDVDRNGCDTRNDVLRRDLTSLVVKPGSQDCVIASGTLQDPYSGRAIAFVRGEQTSSQVQIDHVVALSDAWQKGAQGWDATRRAALANDPLNLLAVDGPLNAQKGDGDTATWLPPNKPYRCAYVARQVGVKYTYGLWVTQAERDAMVRVLSTCALEPLPAGSSVPPAAPVVEAPAAPAPVDPAPAPVAPALAPAPAPAPGVSFKNCTEAWAAGAAPVHVGDPGYAPKLDRDGDGIGCEQRP